MKQNKFDLVLYGATGFVGRQALRYLAQHAPLGIRWAMAGRDAAKLRAAAQAAGVDVPMLCADANDAAALSQMARQARVVLSTAGPYARFGSTLVAACVEQGAHYVDITGETPWVRRMIDDHHMRAKISGIKIVPGCGFDSVPSDLGASMLCEAMPRLHGQALATVKSAFSLGGGGLNGGTAASMLNAVEAGDLDALNNLFLLNEAGTVPNNTSGHEDPFAPSFDPDFKAWIGPFFMGPINSRVVRRSMSLRGDAAAYQEFMRFGVSPLAGMAAAAFSSGSLVGQSLLKMKPVRQLAWKLVPKAGQGPSEAAMNRGWFACHLVGRSATGKRLNAHIGDHGDAGNRATTKMVCECALALVLDEKRLPADAGVVTPSVGLGGSEHGVLATRLRAAGMRVELAP